MKRTGLLLALALCALPARGEPVVTSDALRFALTTADTLPTKDDITAAATDALSQLTDLALDQTTEPGLQLRAIRALPQFCETPCANTPPHDTLLAVIAANQGATTGLSLLRLRTALEALGAAGAKDSEDLPTLTFYLNSASRDIRTATARALRDLCDRQAEPALRIRLQQEQIPQVRLAIASALRDLTESCR